MKLKVVCAQQRRQFMHLFTIYFFNRTHNGIGIGLVLYRNVRRTCSTENHMNKCTVTLSMVRCCSTNSKAMAIVSDVQSRLSVHEQVISIRFDINKTISCADMYLHCHQNCVIRQSFDSSRTDQYRVHSDNKSQIHSAIVMPETKREFIARMMKLHPNVFRTDGFILYCVSCECKVSCKLDLVRQHIATLKHKSSIERKGQPSVGAPRSQSLLFAQQAPRKDVNQFHADTCSMFLEANIPLKKIGHASVAKYIEKYTERTVPSESTLRNKYVAHTYTECLERIRLKAADSYIWFTLDETTDSQNRYVANFLFGTMSETDDSERGKSYLLNLAVLGEVNGSTISAFFIDSLSLLWPNG